LSSSDPPNLNLQPSAPSASDPSTINHQPLTRLITLTGPGGTGKTRLAIEAGERLATTFGGAVWFAPLADLRDPDRIPDALVDALRLSPSPDRPPVEQIVAA